MAADPVRNITAEITGERILREQEPEPTGFVIAAFFEAADRPTQ